MWPAGKFKITELRLYLLFYVNVQVGSALLLDSSAAEQQCASCVLGVAVDRDGACCGVEYLKQGLLAAADLSSAIDVSIVCVGDMVN